MLPLPAMYVSATDWCRKFKVAGYYVRIARHLVSPDPGRPPVEPPPPEREPMPPMKKMTCQRRPMAVLFHRYPRGETSCHTTR